MKKLGILYWIGQLTWGFIMSFIGLVAALICIIFLKGKIHKNGYTIIIEVGGNWGGVSLGCISLCGGYTTTCLNEDWFEHTRRHEFGHSLQNLIFGPVFLFLVAIPSLIRYHCRNYRSKKGLENKDYDAVWFEGMATKWGTKAINKIEAK